MLALLDETGLNPLPAGIYVAVYPSTGAMDSSTLVGNAWTQPGGLADIDVDNAVQYRAAFVGTQAPQQVQDFVGATGTTEVICDGYRSPSLSNAGYAIEQTVGVWPKGPGWWGDEARVVGGVAYPFAYGIGGLLELLDLKTQVVLGMERGQSSFGADLDSWARDFVGKWLTRFVEIGESDASFYGRVAGLLGGEKCTIAGEQAIVNAFYVAIEAELAAAYAGNMTFDGQGGYDSQGGYDVTNPFNPADALPTILVWDRQSRPDLADQYNVNPSNDNGDFVIQIGFNPLFSDGWFLDHSHLDLETYLIDSTTYALSEVAPDPRLAALVNLIKAGGTHPLYLTYIANA